MTVRERILTIRLTEKIGKNPAYGESLMIEVMGIQNSQIQRIEPREICE